MVVKIHEFSSSIYPYKLWITISPELEPLKEKFLDYKGKEMEGDLLGSKARTCDVVQKETMWRGAVIVFTHKTHLIPSVMAHEAYHATRFVWEYIGENYPGEEATAYLIEWIVDCMEQVRTNKFK